MSAVHTDSALTAPVFPIQNAVTELLIGNAVKPATRRAASAVHAAAPRGSAMMCVDVLGCSKTSTSTATEPWMGWWVLRQD